MKRDLLIVIDMQNDFCKPEGVLYNPEAEKIIPNVIDLCKTFLHDDIYFTQDTHYLNYEDTIEGEYIPKHCLAHTNGAALIEELTQFINMCPDQVIQKDTFTVCNWSESYIHRELTAHPYWDVILHLCGVCTDICVISNALALRSLYPTRKIIVHEDCCAGTDKDAHDAAIKIMKSCLIDVVSGE